MEQPRPDGLAVGATSLTRGLCVLILALMAAAALYGASMGIRYFGQIGV